MKKYQGFTLFELLVSISIIGILTAIAAMSYSGVQVKARNTTRINDLNSIQKAEEQYYSKYTTYTTVEGLKNEGLLQQVPADPKTKELYEVNGNVAGDTYCVCRAFDDDNSNTGGNIPMANSAVSDCSDFSRTPKTYYCVKNQQ